MKLFNGWLVRGAAAAGVLFSSLTAANAAIIGHAVAAVVKDEDRDARRIVVSTADGAEETISLALYLEERNWKKGSTLLVRYTDNGTEKVAESIRDLGRKPPKVATGTVVAFDKAARTITLEIGNGDKVVFQIAEHTMVDTGSGVVPAFEYTATVGQRVSIQYTSEGSRKFARVLRSGA